MWDYEDKGLRIFYNNNHFGFDIQYVIVRDLNHLKYEIGKIKYHKSNTNLIKLVDVRGDEPKYINQLIMNDYNEWVGDIDFKLISKEFKLEEGKKQELVTKEQRKRYNEITEGK